MHPTHAEAPTAHDDAGPDSGNGHPGGHAQVPGEHGHGGHGDHVAMFRRRFWWSLLLTVPLVATSHMVMDWFGYELDFPGMAWSARCSAPASSSGAAGRSSPAAGRRCAARRPGMMLLIAMAISVAYAASLATSLGWFDLDFWWELAALITIMLLGHWLEMQALGQAQSALAALAELLPDEAERVRPDGEVETVTSHALEPGRRGPGPGRRAGAGRRGHRRRRGRARRVDGHGRVPSGGQGCRRPGGRRHRRDRLRHPGPGRRGRRRHRPGRHPAPGGRSPGVAEPGPGPGRPLRRPPLLRRRRLRRRHLRGLVAGRLRSTTPSCAPSPCWSSPAPTPSAWPSRWWSRCRRRSPPRPASSSRTGWPWSACAPSTRCCSTRPAP